MCQWRDVNDEKQVIMSVYNGQDVDNGKQRMIQRTEGKSAVACTMLIAMEDESRDGTVLQRWRESVP